MAFHRAGNVDGAAKLYRQIIADNANNAQALQYLGIIEATRRNIAEARALFARSVSIQPRNIQFLENYASILFQMGEYQAAFETSQKGLQLAANNATLLYVSAVALFGLRRLAQSLGQFDKLLAAVADHVAGLNERGSVLANLKDYDAALASVEKALAFAPQYAEAYLNKGNLCVALNRPEDALAAYDKAAAFKPDLAEIWLGRGSALRLGRRHEEAFAAYDKALALKPGLAEAWLGRGNSFFELKRHDEAFAAYDRALALEPDLAGAWLGRGNVLTGRKRFDEAFAAYDKALAREPELASAWLGRGNVLIELRRCDEALAAFDKALAQASDLAKAWLGRGNALAELRRSVEAFAAFDKALALEPDLAEAWVARGNAYAELRRYDEALASFDEAIALKPDFANAYFSKSVCLLLLGRLEEGWRLYEWRSKRDDIVAPPDYLRGLDVSEFVAGDRMRGKRIVVISEQGVGDEIMFGSILPDLVRDAESTTYQLDPRLVGIFSRQFPSVAFFSKNQPEQFQPQNQDMLLRAGSLGYAYRQRAADFPRTPYLTADPGIVGRWQSILGAAETPLRVGFSWRGGTLVSNRDRRSIALDRLRPLLERNDCTFVSLQYGDVAGEISAYNDQASRKIVSFPREDIDNFDHLAALIEALDLVVSVQNTTVHLCGALGKPCLAMLPWKAEWRYGDSGNRMIWYSSVELLRQNSPDNWVDVLDAVDARLSAAVGRKRSE